VRREIVVPDAIGCNAPLTPEQRDRNIELRSRNLQVGIFDDVLGVGRTATDQCAHSPSFGARPSASSELAPQDDASGFPSC
jgi:hypothetical protein